MNQMYEKSITLKDYIRNKDFEFNRDELIEVATYINGEENVNEYIRDSLYEVLKERVDRHIKVQTRPFNKEIIMRELNEEYKQKNKYVAKYMLSDAYDEVFNEYYEKGLVVLSEGKYTKGKYFVTKNLLRIFKSNVSDFEEDLLYIEVRDRGFMQEGQLRYEVDTLRQMIYESLEADKTLKLNNQRSDEEINFYKTSEIEELLNSYLEDASHLEKALHSFSYYGSAIVNSKNNDEKKHYREETLKHIRMKNKALNELDEECLIESIAHINKMEKEGKRLTKK